MSSQMSKQEQLQEQLEKFGIFNKKFDDDGWIIRSRDDAYNMVVAREWFYSNPNLHEEDNGNDDCVFCQFKRAGGGGDDAVSDFFTFMSIKYPDQFDPMLGTYKNLAKGCEDWGKCGQPELYASSSGLTTKDADKARDLGRVIGSNIPLKRFQASCEDSQFDKITKQIAKTKRSVLKAYDEQTKA